MNKFALIISCVLLFYFPCTNFALKKYYNIYVKKDILQFVLYIYSKHDDMSCVLTISYFSISYIFVANSRNEKHLDKRLFCKLYFNIQLIDRCGLKNGTASKKATSGSSAVSCHSPWRCLRT